MGSLLGKFGTGKSGFMDYWRGFSKSKLLFIRFKGKYWFKFFSNCFLTHKIWDYWGLREGDRSLET